MQQEIAGSAGAGAAVAVAEAVAVASGPATKPVKSTSRHHLFKRGNSRPVTMSRDIGAPLRSDPTRRMPSEIEINDALLEALGVVDKAADALGVPADELGERIAASPLLVGAMQAAQRKVDATMEYHIRAGIVHGDISMMAIRLKQQSEAGKGRNPAPGAWASTVVDYTREVESASDLTDSELAAVIRRAAIGEAPADGEACQLCGRLGNGGAQECVDSPAEEEDVDASEPSVALEPDPWPAPTPLDSQTATQRIRIMQRTLHEQERAAQPCAHGDEIAAQDE